MQGGKTGEEAMSPEPKKRQVKVIEFDLSEVMGMLIDSKRRVYQVLPQSQAERKGVEVGDRVSRMGETDCTEMTDTQVVDAMQALKQEGQTVCAVEFNQLVEAYLPDDDEDDYWDSRVNKVHGLTVGGLPLPSGSPVSPNGPVASEVVEVVFDSAGPLYLDFHPARVGATGTYTDGIGCFLVQFRKEPDGSPCWAEKEGRLEPGDLLASANGHVCLDEKPFAEVVSLLQTLDRPLKLSFHRANLKLKLQRLSGQVDSAGLYSIVMAEAAASNATAANANANAAPATPEADSGGGGSENEGTAAAAAGKGGIGSDEAIFFENQRYQPLRGWGSQNFLLPTDRGTWSNRGGTAWSHTLDTELYDMVIDLSLPGCDAEGWEYAFDFSYFRRSCAPSARMRTKNSYVRRRQWVPRSVLEGAIAAAENAGVEFAWGVRKTKAKTEQQRAEEEERRQQELVAAEAAAAVLASPVGNSGAGGVPNAMAGAAAAEPGPAGGGADAAAAVASPGTLKRGCCIPHQFAVHTFKTPTWCGVCNKLLVGLWRQGLRCQVSGARVHASDLVSPLAHSCLCLSMPILNVQMFDANDHTGVQVEHSPRMRSQSPAEYRLRPRCLPQPGSDRCGGGSSGEGGRRKCDRGGGQDNCRQYGKEREGARERDRKGEQWIILA